MKDESPPHWKKIALNSTLHIWFKSWKEDNQNSSKLVKCCKAIYLYEQLFQILQTNIYSIWENIYGVKIGRGGISPTIWKYRIWASILSLLFKKRVIGGFRLPMFIPIVSVCNMCLICIGFLSKHGFIF